MALACGAIRNLNKRRCLGQNEVEISAGTRRRQMDYGNSWIYPITTISQGNWKSRGEGTLFTGRDVSSEIHGAGALRNPGGKHERYEKKIFSGCGGAGCGIVQLERGAARGGAGRRASKTRGT